MGGKENEGRESEEGRGKGEGGEGKRRGRDVEGPGKWSAPGPALALGGPVDRVKQDIVDKSLKDEAKNHTKVWFSCHV